MAAPWISPPCHPCPSDDALRRLRPGIASAQDGGDGRVKEDARDGGSRALHVAAGRGRMTVCVYLVISMFSDTIPFELPELLAIASSAFHKNMETVKEMSNDEYIQIPRDILKRVLAGDGVAEAPVPEGATVPQRAGCLLPLSWRMPKAGIVHHH